MLDGCHFCFCLALDLKLRGHSVVICASSCRQAWTILSLKQFAVHKVA